MTEPDDRESGVVAVAEASTSGRVVAIRRDPRWRPCWWVDVERSGDVLHLYARGNRTGMGGVNDVFREADAAEAMDAAGIPVAAVWARSEELDFVLWEALPGVDNASIPPAEQAAARVAHAEVLARLHAADVGPFVAEDRRLPATPRDVAFADHDGYVELWRAGQPRPEPLITFVDRWLASTMPGDLGPPAVLAGDAGQFMWDGEKVTGLIDLEMCHLGDPHHDLAYMRMRDLNEPIGGVADAYQAWAAAGDFDLDLQKVRWFGVMGPIEPAMGLSFITAAPLPPGDLAQYLTWYTQLQRVALDALAEHESIELDPPDPEAESGEDSAVIDNAWAVGTTWLDEHAPRRDVGDDPEVLRHRRGAQALTELARRAAVHAPGLDAASQADLARLDGRASPGVTVRARMLEVLDDPTVDPADLVRVLHRWITRAEWLAQPVMGNEYGRSLSPVE